MINGEEIITTVDHPFYVNDRGFVNAGELAVGDELLDSNKNILLVENFDVELTDEPTTVYNFQVEDLHTYHVSGFGVLVHNAGDDYAKPTEPYNRRKHYGNTQRRKTGRLWVVLQIMIPHWLNDIMKETLVQVKSQVIK